MALMKIAAYTPSSWRDCHDCISSMTLSVILEIVSFDTDAPLDLCEMRRDLSGSRPFRVQREHHLVDPVQAPFPFRDDHRSERPSRSRGTSMETSTVASVRTVFGRVPLRTLPPARSAGARFFG